MAQANLVKYQRIARAPRHEFPTRLSILIASETQTFLSFSFSFHRTLYDLQLQISNFHENSWKDLGEASNFLLLLFVADKECKRRAKVAVYLTIEINAR